MIRSFKAKVAIAILMALLIIMLGLTVVVSEQEGSAISLKGADDSLNYYTADFDTEWTTSTYHNAPDFTLDTFLGKNVISYFLDTNYDEQYSTTASIISSKTDAFKVDGVLQFYYYTRQEKSLPHVISAYGSSNGEDFYFMDEAICFDNGADSKTWSIASLDIKAGTEYLKLDWTVYFGKVDGVDKEDGALVFNLDDITVTCVEDTDFAYTEFNFELVKSAYYYDGSVITPEYNVSADTLHDFYTTYRFEQGGSAIEPVHVGSYDLVVDLHNQAGRLCATFTDTVEILPETVTLDSYEIINNGTYAVITNATFVDAKGRKVSIEEADVRRVYDGTQEVIIEVGSTDFTPYQTNLGIIATDVTAPYAFYLNSDYVTCVYDGTVKSVSDNLKVFSSYDFDADTYVDYSAAFAITYFDSEGNTTEPKYVGTYTYSIPFGRREIKGTLEITPRLINYGDYVGSANLDKKYDGTTFLSVDGVISNTLPTDSIVLSDILDGDIVNISYEKATYVKDVGLTYLALDGITLSGDSASNYAISEDFYVNATARITATTLILNSLNTSDGVISVEDKEYDGNDSANIVGPSSALDMLGAGNTVVTVSDLTATFDGVDSGLRGVKLEVTNRALFDRFLPEVIINTELSANVTKRNLQAEVSLVSDTEKEYDGTTNAKPIISTLSLINVEDYGDGFIDIVNLGTYSVKYESALYNNANAGDKKITVTGISMLSNDYKQNSVLNNYYIDNVVFDGVIKAKQISILTEYVRIYEGEALPNLRTTASEMGITAMTIHANILDAENNTNAISNVRIPSGEYFIRVSCTSNNYTLGGAGYAIIPLTVTAIDEKISQEIVIDNVNMISKKITMLVGGEFTLNAISYTKYAGTVYETGLMPEFKASGSVGSVSSDGTIYANTVGSFTVTVSQSGNENYNKAKDIILSVDVKQDKLNAEYEYTDNLYVDDELPDLNGHVNVKVGAYPVIGRIEKDDGRVLLGENKYTYYFVADTYYEEYFFEGTLPTRYELGYDGRYVVSEDTSYVPGKVYYSLEGTPADVAEGENIINSAIFYYELVDDVFVLTNDIVVDKDKTYYTVTGKLDETRTIVGILYEKVGEDYVITSDSEMLAGKTYYYQTKSVYGRTPFAVILLANKRALNVTLDGSYSIAYGENFDFINALSSAEIDGQPISYDDIVNKLFGGGFVLNLVNTEGAVAVNVNELLPNVYAIDVAMGVEDSYYVDFDDESLVYDVILNGNVTLTVQRSVLNIGIENFEKYYYQDLPTKEELLALLKISGSHREEDIDAILASVVVTLTIDKYSSPGQYSVLLDGNATLDNYELTFVEGYVSVLPVPITVYASTNGHEYGRRVSAVNLNILFDNANYYSREDMIILQDIISDNVILTVDVTNDSPVGDYYIEFNYTADNNFYEFKYIDSYYVVRTSTFTDMLFNDKHVLYDGNRHTMEIEYDVNQWPNIKVEYNYTYFVEPGEYTFVATVSQANYTTAVLEATLYIGVLTIQSSNLTNNFVQMTIIDETCLTGINSAYELTLIKEEELTSAQADVINEKMSEYNVFGVYSVMISHGVESVIMGYTGYELKLSPADFKNSERVKLFGYKDGQYQELEYNYEDGMIIVTVDNLEGITIVEEIIKEVDMTSAWIFVVIIVIVMLLVLGIISKHFKKHKKFKAKSRKRHHRWA